MNSYWQKILLCGALAGALALGGCGSDHHDSTPVTTGQYSILTGGGSGGENGGSGGDGNYIGLYNESSTGGNIVIKASGSADASFTPSSFTPYYGTNPLTISSDTTIAEETVTEPAAGTAYIGSDNQLHVSDGNSILNDEPPVTGLLVKNGATVTFGVPGTADLSFGLDNDFANFGTVTTADQDAADRGDLTFNCGSFLNYGTVALNATAAGQNGGSLAVSANSASNGGSVLNKGTIDTYGGDATDANAGAGGDIDLDGRYFCENTGAIDSHGGATSGTTGIGGDGGYIDLYTDNGDIRNSATVNSYGGDGISGGGNGGYFEMYVDWTGDCVNSGAINTYGGATGTGSGGVGGEVDLETWQGGIRHNAAVNARGGSATDPTGNGGGGGDATFGSYSGESYQPTPGDYTPVKDTEISGDIDLRGGAALATGSGNGGKGGAFESDLDGYGVPLGQEMRLLGYQRLDSRGGDGNYGGTGGYVDAFQEYAVDDDQYNNPSQKYNPGGFLIDGTDIDTRGGSAVATAGTTPASGGDGGYVSFDMDPETYVTAAVVPFAPPKFSLRGSINTSGGDNLDETGSHGNAGDVYLYAKQGVAVDGDITAKGGNDAGTSVGYGGDGGAVNLMADYGDVTITGNIDMSGGDGALHGGNAGVSSDYPVAGTSQGVVSTGNITADGGDADAALSGSVGGNAEDFWLFSTQGPSGVSFGTLSAKGGTGETAGSNAEISAGAYQVAP